MIRIAFLGGLVALTGSAAAPADPEAGPGGSEGYRIAFSFRKRDPAETFRYQVYDVRGGQYTRAVDEWLGLMKSRYPDHVAEILDADSADGVSAAIEREREVVRARQDRLDAMDEAALRRYLARPAYSGDTRAILPQVPIRELPSVGGGSTPGGMGSLPFFMIPNPIIR